MKLQTIALSALCGLFASSVLAEGSADEGQTKVIACIACHGVNGNSINPEWPSLAGQHKQYIQKQLHAFKTGTRQNALMTPMVQPLSDDDIEDIAAYYDAQKLTGLEAEPSKVSMGQRLFRGGNATLGIAACQACHGPAGAGNPTALYPTIAGQRSTYVVNQLKAYRAGTRQTDQNQMMRNIAKSLSDEQIDAVAAYVQGLR
jgi:cytochrome c553